MHARFAPTVTSLFALVSARARPHPLARIEFNRLAVRRLLRTVWITCSLLMKIFGILAFLGGIASLPLPAAASASAMALTIDGNDRVGRHEKIEFKLQVQRIFANPYDPDEAEVNVEFTSPSGKKLIVPAFFHQPYEFQLVPRQGRPTEWLYPSGPAGWRARFAPDETGRYSAAAVLRQGRGEVRSSSVSFEAVPSPSRGYVRVSKSDPRYFEFSDGTPFFPIGQNLAFIGTGQYLDTERAIGVFRKMSENGANFARIWTCSEDWAMAIEARKSAWSRSWSWRPPFAAIPGNEGYHSGELAVRLGGANAQQLSVSPTQPVALRPGTQYRLSARVLTEPETALSIQFGNTPLGKPVRSEKAGQWSTFSEIITAEANQSWLGDLTLRANGEGQVWIRNLSLQESGGGPELLWEADPNRGPRGFYSQTDSFMLDRLLEAAATNKIYLQLCLLTRDHYRFALRDPNSAAYQQAIRDARNFLRYAVARWGYSPHVFAWEYFNEMDPNAPTERFHQELGEYLEQIDLYGHMRMTSGWGPAPRQWTHPKLDIASFHWYLREVWSPLWKDEVASVLDRAALVRSHASNKPAILGEFGLATDAYGRSSYMEQDRDNVHVHNAQWAAALSGLSGGAFFWWWEVLDKNNAYTRYRPVANFVADIPFTTAQLEPLNFTTENERARVVALRGKDRVYAWISNPQAAWWNWVVDKIKPAVVKQETFTVDQLTPGAYRIEWWDTQAGKILEERTIESAGARVQIAIPDFERDIALKLIRR
jgi:hypothetical protein